MNKLILILVSLVMLSLRSDNDGKTIYFFSSTFENLNGHVRQLTEVNTGHIGNFGVIKKPSCITADFDKKGDIVQVLISPDQTIKFNTNYDSKGKRISTIGNLVVKTICTYDDSGRIGKLILKNVLDKDSPGMVTEYKYNNNDDVVEGDILDPSGKISIKEMFSYDEKRHLTVHETIVKDQPGLKMQYQYLSFDQRTIGSKE